jgi:thioredoxin 1
MNEKQSFHELTHGEKPVLVDFFAEWCGPCKMMKPILEELKSRVGEKACIVKVDVDKNQTLASSLNVRGVPTLAIFKKGQIVWRKSGVMSAQDLEEIIQSYI